MTKFFKRNSTKLTISEFYDNYKLEKYNFDAPYQRKSDVWSDDKRSFLIDSILKNYPMPAIFMRPIVDADGKTQYDIVDGKQRLQAIINFIEGSTTLTSYFAEDSFVGEDNREAAEKIAGKTFSEIKTEGSSDYVKQFWTYTLQIEYLYDDNTDLISSVFDRLNRNGEPLNRQELRKARYANTPIIFDIRCAGYEVVVVSTRCATIEGYGAVRAWLINNGIEVDGVKTEKPPAIVYIDDRANCFDGEHDNLLNKISGFEPWYKNTVKTNADRIRSMSDEELANHLHEIGWDCHLCAEHGRLDNEFLLRGEKCDEKCAEHCLEWLKKPAE